jgi:hypothetical protein
MDTGRSDDENPATDTLHRAVRIAEKRFRAVLSVSEKPDKMAMFYLCFT